MNTASFFGQLSSTVLVGYLRVPTLVIISTFCCSVLLFGMIGVHTVASVVIFGILYGFFVGICASFDLMRPLTDIPFMSVIAMWAPVVTVLTPDLSELG